MSDVKKLVMLTEYGASPEKIAKVLGPTRNQIMRAIRDFVQGDAVQAAKEETCQ